MQYIPHEPDDGVASSLPLRRMDAEPPAAKRPRPADEAAPVAEGAHAAAGPSAAAETAQINPNAKRKVAMLVAYNGDGYAGLQKNPDVVTVESVLEAALHRVGAISDDNFGTLQKVSWSRAGRTDKGVHALGQIVSLKMVLAAGATAAGINAELAGARIRVLGFERTNNNFCAHTMCSSREYEYLLPAAALRAAGARAAGAAAGAEEEVAGAAGAAAPLTDEEAGRLRGLLRQLEGTHSFHNFTDGKLTSSDASAQRFIMSIALGEAVTLGGVAYVPIHLHGQSFLLHQIRKMVALVAASFRGDVPADAIERALGKTRVPTIPLAPSCALLLRRCRYDNYERKRLREFPERKSAHFPECDADKDAFLREHILPHIAQCEANGEFARFVEALKAYRFEQPAAHGATATEGEAPSASAEK
jgi:tRNA pseudouridine38-40 synthase